MAIAERPMKVSEIIDQRPLGGFQIGTITMSAIVLVLDGFATQSIGFLAPSMAKTLGLPIHRFGAVFSAALFGLMISSLIAGPIADRVGRKWPIIFATLTFGIFSIATARATSFNELVVFRFLTGLGLGGAIPNAVALTAEYAPKRLQRILVTTLFSSMPLGALLGGLVSFGMLDRWGWRAVFLVGGITPVAVAFLLMKFLPESIRFMSVRNGRKDREESRKILLKIAPEISADNVDLTTAKEDQRLEGNSVGHLFAEGRAVGTLLLWVPFFMNLLSLYFIINWLPALLRQTQMPVSAGIIGVSIFSLGGIVGSLTQGRMMNAWGNTAVLIAEFLLSLLVIGSVAFIQSFAVMMAVIFVLGFSIQGAQAGLNALSATTYPTPIRSTGVGWALGVGRLGSIVGPLLGGVMIARSWSLREIFFAGTLPALIAAVAILMRHYAVDKSRSGAL